MNQPETYLSSRSDRRRWVALAGFVAAVTALSVGVAPARADIAFGPVGAGAGQLEDPSDIAVDHSTGEVFVAEGQENNSGNARISVFDEDGDFLRAFGWGVDTGAAQLEVCTAASECQRGIAGSGAGQIAGAEPQVAVDNDPLSPSFGEVHVFEPLNHRIERFTAGGAFVLAIGDGVNQTTGGDVCTATTGHTCKAGTSGDGPAQFTPSTANSNNVARLAVAPGGVLHVADYTPAGSRLQRFDHTGAFLSQLGPLTGTSGTSATLALAVETGGSFYITINDGGGPIRKFDPAGNPVASFNSEAQTDLTHDSAGNLYALSERGHFIAGFDSLGNLTSATYGELALGSDELSALAARSTPNGDFYVLDRTVPEQIIHLSFEPPGPVVLPHSAQVGDSAFAIQFHRDTKADPVGTLTATLKTKVNPEGEATTVHFEYVDEAEHQANGFTNAVTTPETSSIGADFAVHETIFDVACAAPGQPGCLTPDTLYHLRAVATNADGQDIGREATFRTLPSIELGETYSTDVGIEAATLHAALNPNGLPTTARFQYVTEAEFQAEGFADPQVTPDPGDPPLDYGSGSSELERTVSLSGLMPGTTYRYRLVANNFYGSFPTAPVPFHTYALADPPETDCPNQQFRDGTPSASLANCRAYERVSPADKGGGDAARDAEWVPTGQVGAPQNDQAAPDGARFAYASAQRFAEPEGGPWTTQYLAARDDSDGWTTENISPPRQTPPFFPAVMTAPPQTSFTADLCTAFLMQDNDRALVPEDNPGHADAFRRRNCEPDSGSYELLSITPPPPASAGITFEPRVQGASADGSFALLRANAKLTANASNATATQNLAASGSGPGGQGPAFQLYLNNGSSLRLVSVLPNGVAADRSTSLGNFNTQTTLNWTWKHTLENSVSEDGDRVYWETLDKTGSDEQNKLYVRVNPDRSQSPLDGGQCTDPDRACTHAVSETVDPGHAEFEAASPDGSRALFKFSSGPEAGTLYRYDLATHSSTEIAPDLIDAIIGASEDLSRVYFASTAVLDAGAVAGARNVYLQTEGEGTRLIGLPDPLGASTLHGDFAFRYDRDTHMARVTPDGAHAVFVSTDELAGHDSASDATGAPTTQVFLYDAEADGSAGALHCVSCTPSGARPSHAKNLGGLGEFSGIVPVYPYDRYASRLLAPDGGRLFFESFESLLPADTNGAKDVYQWEKPGSADCGLTDADYFELNGGCLSLISGGIDPGGSAFLDASTEGSDVFVSTRESLHGSDTDELIDIYDARVEGGFPAPPPPPDPCSGDECQGPPSGEPSDPGSGSSAPGPGNQGKDRTPAAKCPKGRKLRNGRCVKKNRKRGRR